MNFRHNILRIIFCATLLAVNFSLLADEKPAAGSLIMPPVPVPAKSPVEKFRDLLKMTPAQRTAALGTTPAPLRERILGKVQQYEKMPPPERELKLQQTQLRWLLVQAIELPASQRDQIFSRLNPADRALLDQRLAQWDRLPLDIQQQILDYQVQIEKITEARETEETVKFANAEKSALPFPSFGNQNSNPSAPQHPPQSFNPTPLPPAPARLPAGFLKFIKMPRDQREKIVVSYQKFFQLSEDEKQKVLVEINSSRRQSTMLAVAELNKLSVEERQKTLAELRSLAGMTDAEQSDFLKNSLLWQSLTPEQREVWRRIALRTPSLPPTPPGLLVLPTPPPHLTAQQAAGSGIDDSNH